MAEYKPLTHQERSNWALTLAYPPRDDETQLEHEMGLAILRYDDALQAKDAQIIELAQAILDADYDDLQRPRELARAAIKEATNGS